MMGSAVVAELLAEMVEPQAEMIGRQLRSWGRAEQAWLTAQAGLAQAPAPPPAPHRPTAHPLCWASAADAAGAWRQPVAEEQPSVAAGAAAGDAQCLQWRQAAVGVMPWDACESAVGLAVGPVASAAAAHAAAAAAAVATEDASVRGLEVCWAGWCLACPYIANDVVSDRRVNDKMPGHHAIGS